MKTRAKKGAAALLACMGMLLAWPAASSMAASVTLGQSDFDAAPKLNDGRGQWTPTAGDSYTVHGGHSMNEVDDNNISFLYGGASGEVNIGSLNIDIQSSDRGGAMVYLYSPVTASGPVTLTGQVFDGQNYREAWLNVAGGTVFTSAQGTTVNANALLRLGDLEADRVSMGAVHKGKLDMTGSNARIPLDSEYPGMHFYNSYMQVMGGSPDNPNTVDGAFNVAGPGSGASVVIGNREAMCPANVRSYLKVTGTTFFGVNSSFILWDAVDGTLQGNGGLGGAGSNTLTVNGGSQLYIGGGQEGTYKLVTGFADNKGTADPAGAWIGNNLASNSLLKVDGRWLTPGADNNWSNYELTVTRNDINGILPKLNRPLGNMINTFLGMNSVDPDSANSAVRFLSRAGDLGRLSEAEGAAVIEGAARMANAAGVSSSAMNAASVATDAVSARMTAAANTGMMIALNKEGPVTGMAAGSEYQNGLAVWGMPLYSHDSASGLRSGAFKSGYVSDLGGFALGADYTFDSSFRLGMAVNAGGGNARSKGDFQTTKNNIDFWGLNLYGSYRYNNFTLSGDAAYTGTRNSMHQNLPDAMNMPSSKAKVNGNVWSLGLRAAYTIPTTVLDITPYAGVRYNHVATDAYDVKNPDVVFHVGKNTQNLWTFPVGVEFSREITTQSGWKVAPSLSVGVKVAAGSLDAKNSVRLPGLIESTELISRAYDRATFDSTLGLSLGKGNTSVGVNYNLQASGHRTAHGVNAMFRYSF